MFHGHVGAGFGWIPQERSVPPLRIFFQPQPLMAQPPSVLTISPLRKMCSSATLPPGVPREARHPLESRHWYSSALVDGARRISKRSAKPAGSLMLPSFWGRLTCGSPGGPGYPVIPA